MRSISEDVLLNSWIVASADIAKAIGISTLLSEAGVSAGSVV